MSPWSCFGASFNYDKNLWQQWRIASWFWTRIVIHHLVWLPLVPLLVFSDVMVRSKSNCVYDCSFRAADGNVMYECTNANEVADSAHDLLITVFLLSDYGWGKVYTTCYHENLSILYLFRDINYWWWWRQKFVSFFVGTRWNFYCPVRSTHQRYSCKY